MTPEVSPMLGQDNPREGPSAIQLQQLAAFIDGEGCITIKHSGNSSARRRNGPYHTVFVSVANSDRRVAALFDGLFPGRIVFRSATKKWKAAHIWELTDALKVVLFLAAIHPYLLLKGPQAELVLDFMTGFRRGGGFVIGPEEHLRREQICKAIKARNRKGPPATTEREGTSNGDATV